MTRGPLAFQSKFTNNALVVIDALSDSDLQSARRLADDVGAMAAAEGRAGYCRYFKVRSAAELEGLLQEVHAQCHQGLRPILHVESHGDKLAGIEIGATGEMVPWSAIEVHFRAINKTTKNNLGVVIAACFGLHAITPLKIGERCLRSARASAGLLRDNRPDPERQHGDHAASHAQNAPSSTSFIREASAVGVEATALGELCDVVRQVQPSGTFHWASPA